MTKTQRQTDINNTTGAISIDKIITSYFVIRHKNECGQFLPRNDIIRYKASVLVRKRNVLIIVSTLLDENVLDWVENLKKDTKANHKDGRMRCSPATTSIKLPFKLTKVTSNFNYTDK